MVSIHKKVKPPIKWAGGKTQLLPQFRPLFPRNFSGYAEPFLGGGAVFFELRPKNSILIDSNFDLINFYLVVKNNCDRLIEYLRNHKNTPEYYYEIRKIDPNSLDDVSRASRFLYLNKTGYNGLWRVNTKGEFNVPFGSYRRPKIVDKQNLFLVSKALQDVTLLCADFEVVEDYIKPGDFVYFDPPYHPLTKTARFTRYTEQSFGENEQIRLSKLFSRLDKIGCLLMLSNSDTPLTRRLYRKYNIATVQARRPINCRPDMRGYVNEIVVRNYDGNIPLDC